MNDKYLKPYSPSTVEDSIYKQWENSGYFNPDKLDKFISMNIGGKMFV